MTPSGLAFVDIALTNRSLRGRVDRPLGPRSLKQGDQVSVGDERRELPTRSASRRSPDAPDDPVTKPILDVADLGAPVERFVPLRFQQTQPFDREDLLAIAALKVTGPRFPDPEVDALPIDVLRGTRSIPLGFTLTRLAFDELLRGLR